MFSLIFSKEKINRVFHLKVCGVRSCNSAVVWGNPIEYMIGKNFVDALNEHRIPEEELFDATIAVCLGLHVSINQL